MGNSKNILDIFKLKLDQKLSMLNNLFRSSDFEVLFRN